MNHPIFPLRRLALVLAFAYAPFALAASAGRIEFATGESVVRGSDGRERPARKGDAINPGERILTQAGRAQIAFTDGGFVSLQPNTDFGVDEYVFKGSNDGSEKSVFSLLKGALRTVTGLVGRSKRDAYTMNTPTATIGIRGTGGQIEVNSEGTFVRGTSGTWLLTNQGGTLNVPAGSNGFAGQDSKKTPEQSSAGPNTPPANSGSAGPNLSTQPYSAGDQIGAVTLPPATTVKLAMKDGAGYTANMANSDGSLLLNPSVTATFDAGAGKVLQGFGNYSISTAQAFELGNDGLIGWGRWASGTAVVNGANTPLTANQGVHYVVGIPTASMPTVGSATYTLLGSTNPTLISGGGVPGVLNSGTLSVNFAGATLNYSIQATAGGYVYTANGTGVALSGNAFTHSSFVSYSTSACPSTNACTGSIQGVFMGSAADRAGLIYTIYGPVPADTVAGAITFKK